MKIAVVGANGRSGKLIVEELVNRGHDVTAITRKPNQSKAQKSIQKDLYDLTPKDVEEFDAIVDAFGVWQPEEMPKHSSSLMHLSDIVSGRPTRLLVVGGAGSLFTDPSHTKTVMDDPGFPEIFVPVAKGMADALAALRKRNDVDWTFISPAGDFQAEGPRTGKYIQAGEELKLNSKGESKISYADFAIAMADEIEKGHHIKERISVLSE